MNRNIISTVTVAATSAPLSVAGLSFQVCRASHGNGSCTCPDFQVRTAQEGRICKHIAAAAITALAPQSKASSPANGNGSVRATESAAAEASPLIFRIRRNVQSDGKNGTLVEVQAHVTNDEVQDQETASYAYELLERLASLAGKEPRTLRKQLRSGNCSTEHGKNKAD